jgi:anti-sigma factor RsiW
MSGPPDDDDLHARLDGQLPPERAAALDSRLAADPEMRRRWSRYAEQRGQLRASLAAAADELVPARLNVGHILSRQRLRRATQIAAGIALLALGVIAGWSAQYLGSPAHNAAAAAASSVAAEAVAAHRVFAVETRHPVEIGADHEALLVQWLSKRLGRPLVVPDLSTAGFRLVGGRLLPSGTGPAAQLMYENAYGIRLTCYYLAVDSSGETGLKYRDDDGVGVQYWVDDGFGYAVAATADRALVERVSKLVYRQTDEDAGKAKPAPPAGKPG